jgi:glutaredoxin
MASLYTVYTKPACSYCDKTKTLLQNVYPPPIWVDCSDYLKNEASKQLFLKFIQDTAQLPVAHRTFPIVFCNGRFVGGYTETAAAFQERQFSTHHPF